jgi:hypothetical protein
VDVSGSARRGVFELGRFESGGRDVMVPLTIDGSYGAGLVRVGVTMDVLDEAGKVAASRRADAAYVQVAADGTATWLDEATAMARAMIPTAIASPGETVEVSLVGAEVQP